MALQKFSDFQFQKISEFLNEEELILVQRCSKKLHQKMEQNLAIKNRILKHQIEVAKNIYLEIKLNPLYTIYGLKSKKIQNGQLVNKYNEKDFELFLFKNGAINSHNSLCTQMQINRHIKAFQKNTDQQIKIQKMKQQKIKFPEKHKEITEDIQIWKMNFKKKQQYAEYVNKLGDFEDRILERLHQTEQKAKQKILNIYKRFV